jgi:hypothetical protein
MIVALDKEAANKAFIMSLARVKLVLKSTFRVMTI